MVFGARFRGKNGDNTETRIYIPCGRSKTTLESKFFVPRPRFLPLSRWPFFTRAVCYVTKSALIYKLRVMRLFFGEFRKPFFSLFFGFRKFRKNSTPKKQQKREEKRKIFLERAKNTHKKKKKKEREREKEHTQRVNKYDTGFREERR